MMIFRELECLIIFLVQFPAASLGTPITRHISKIYKCLSKLYGNNSIIGTYNLYLLNIYSFQEAELMFNVRW